MNLFRVFFPVPLTRGSAFTRPILRRHLHEHLLPEKARYGCVNGFLPLDAHDSMSHGLALEIHCIVMRALPCAAGENYSSQAFLCSIGLGRVAPSAVKHITPGPWPAAAIQATASRLSRSAPREECSRSHDTTGPIMLVLLGTRLGVPHRSTDTADGSQVRSRPE